jgi:hypothetical protein
MMSSTEEISKENMLFHENRLYDGNIIKEEGYKGIIGNKGKPIKKKEEEEEKDFTSVNVTRENFYEWLLIQHSKKKIKNLTMKEKGRKAMSKIKIPSVPLWKKKNDEPNEQDNDAEKKAGEKSGDDGENVDEDVKNVGDNGETLKYNNKISIELDEKNSFKKFTLKITKFENKNIKDLFAIDDVLNEYAHIKKGPTINDSTLTIPYEKGINKEGKNLYDILLKLDLSNK